MTAAHRLWASDRNRMRKALAQGKQAVASAGRVAVIADRFPAIIHDFVMLNALADTNAARGAITLATDTLRAVLSDRH